MATVTDFMTPHPATVGPDDTVQRAALLMDELNVGALPVVRGWRLLGMVTDRDITVRATAAGLDPATTVVERVMSGGVRCCSPENSVADVLRQMASVQIRRMPVVDAAGLVVGIVTLGDLAVRQPEGVERTLGQISTPAEPDRPALAA